MKKPNNNAILFVLQILAFLLIWSVILIVFSSKAVSNNNAQEALQQPYITAQLSIPKNDPKPTISATVVRNTAYNSDWDYLLKQYDWNIDTARAIMLCESGGNPNALNTRPPDYSIGLFQINLYGSLKYSRPSEEWLRVPENNVAYAYSMWKTQGWRPWACYYKI